MRTKWKFNMEKIESEIAMWKKHNIQNWDMIMMEKNCFISMFFMLLCRCWLLVRFFCANSNSSISDTHIRPRQLGSVDWECEWHKQTEQIECGIDWISFDVRSELLLLLLADWWRWIKFFLWLCSSGKNSAHSFIVNGLEFGWWWRSLGEEQIIICI